MVASRRTWCAWALRIVASIIGSPGSGALHPGTTTISGKTTGRGGRDVRQVVRIFLVTLLAVATPAFGQGAWPQKPVRVIVPFPAGGSADTLCRLLAEKLAGAWGQPVVIDNRAGAGGNVGAEIAARAEPDGHTLLCSPPGPLAINH